MLGDGPVAGNAFDIGFYLSTDADIKPGGRQIADVVDGVDLVPNTFFNSTISIALPGVGDGWLPGEGTYFIGMYVDDTFNVVELNESNNYRSEAVSVNVPGPGDFDQNGTHDCADIDALVQAIVLGTNQLPYDLNGDLLVNGDDLEEWLRLERRQIRQRRTGTRFSMVTPTRWGCRRVGFQSLEHVEIYVNRGLVHGDFNADGVVDISDFNLWNGNKFQSSDAPFRIGAGDQMYVVPDRFVHHEEARERVFEEWYLL